MLTIILTFCISLCTDLGITGSEIEIKGRLIDYDTKKSVSHGTIIIKGTTEGAISDENGFFKFNTSIKNLTLEISTIEHYKVIIQNIPQRDIDLGTIEMFEQNVNPIQYEIGELKRPNKRKEKKFRTKILPDYRFTFDDRQIPLRLVDNTIIIGL